MGYPTVTFDHLLDNDAVLAFVDSRITPEPNCGCWLWLGHVNLSGSGIEYAVFVVAGQTYRAARFMYRRFKGPIPPNLLVRHRCDVGLCVNPDHLELGTHAENSRDMVVRGRHRNGSHILVGERVKGSKLKAVDIPVIRARVAAGDLHREIASDYGVSKQVVSSIIRGLAWKSVP